MVGGDLKQSIPPGGGERQASCVPGVDLKSSYANIAPPSCAGCLPPTWLAPAEPARRMAMSGLSRWVAKSYVLR